MLHIVIPVFPEARSEDILSAPADFTSDGAEASMTSPSEDTKTQ